MDPRELVLRLSVAGVLGCLVGLERHWSDKAAGMRTHMLVSLGSALFMIVSAYGFDGVLRDPVVRLDPSRVASQVVSGIGFLGAGTILRRNETVLGLTTAASVWAIAAVGLAAGGGLYLAAIVATVLILVILAGIRPVEARIAARDYPHTLTLLVSPAEFAPTDLEALLHAHALEIAGIRSRRAQDAGRQHLEITLGRASAAKLLDVIGRLPALKGVIEAAYEGIPTP